MGVHKKMQFLGGGGGGGQNEPTNLWDCLKRGAWTVCRF